MQDHPIFHPRQYQLKVLDAIDRGYKRIFLLWHRRSGKDLTLWQIINSQAWQTVGLYYYFLPTFTQAKRIIWDGITNDGQRFLDYTPKQLIENTNISEMKIELKNGSIIQLIGTDRYDSIRGTNPIGCVFSEYAYQNPMAWEVVKPILKVNKGWAIFNTTPNGKNHSYELHTMAKTNPNWFSEVLSIKDTKVLTGEDIADEEAEGMTKEMIAQEYYCSYDVGALGSYYADQVNKARKENRICNLPIEPHIAIDLWLDLGRSDSTAIIFTQTLGKEIRIIDYHEENGKELMHYIQLLRDKEYNYGVVNLPHDARQRRLEARSSVQEQFDEAGFTTTIVPKAHIQNGIAKVRQVFPRLWFNKTKTKQLLRALENYHKEYDEKAKVFRNNPKHDWSSHGADALRYLSVGHKDSKASTYESDAQEFAIYESGRPKKPHPDWLTPEEHRDYDKKAIEIMNA